MDADLNALPADVGPDELKSVLKKWEEDLEKKSVKEWEEHWLRHHNINPIIIAERHSNLSLVSEKEGKRKPDVFIDVNEMSGKTWEDVRTDLRKLRNFTDNDLSPRELDILQSGFFLLYKVEVPHFSVQASIVMDKRCTLCFIKCQNSIKMVILLGPGNDQTPQLVEFDKRNWICRNGNLVSFHIGPGLAICTAEFHSLVEAMEFEFMFMFVSEFANDCIVVRIYGRYAIEQFIFKGLAETENQTKPTDYGEKMHHPYLTYLGAIKQSYGEFSSRLCKSSFEEPLGILRRRMTEYMKNAYNLKAFIFKSCISFDRDKMFASFYTERLVGNDCETLLRITVFSDTYDSPSTKSTGRLYLRSFAELEVDLASLMDSLPLCNRLCAVLAQYCALRDKFIGIANRVWAIVHESEQMDPLGFNLIAHMNNYLEKCERDSIIPEKFVILDQILRVGNDSIFGCLKNSLGTELVGELSRCLTFNGLNKGFLENRHAEFEGNIMTRQIDDHSVPLSHLPKSSKNYSKNDFSTASFVAGENFINELAKQCNILCCNLSDIIEKHMLKFDINEWLMLVCENNCNVNEIHLESPRIIDHENDQDASLLGGKQSNSFIFPKDWKKYLKYSAEEFGKEGEPLGSGGYGRATVLSHHTMGSVVLKQYLPKTSSESRIKEIEMLICLQNNQHIVKLIGFFYSKKNDFESVPEGILLEYVPRDLNSFIHERKGSFKYSYDYKTAIQQMQGMASAFAAMHEQGIMHRDIKPANILLTLNGEIKVCDLGISGVIDKKERTNGCFGTLSYISPEIMNGLSNYNEKTDVFSLAVTMWEQVHRRHPYSKHENIFQFVFIENKRLDISEKCPQELKEIIQKSWSKDPQDRPSMMELDTMLGQLFRSIDKRKLSEGIDGSFQAVPFHGAIFCVEITDDHDTDVSLSESGGNLDSFQSEERTEN